MSEAARVTVVVVPRERFSLTPAAVDAVIENTGVPYELVVVDGGSPKSVANALRDRASRHGIRLIREDRYLYPNHARNLGLADVETEYVVFLDNDALVDPNWLAPLVACADETGAAVVGPLYLQGDERVVHSAGGKLVEESGMLIPRMQDQESPMDEVRPRVTRAPADFVEFHCMLVRREVFDRTGPFDEQVTATREHFDFILHVRDVGGTVWFEPDSIVTYMPPRELTWADLRYLLFRWGGPATRETLEHLGRKWGIEVEVGQERLVRRRRRDAIECFAGAKLARVGIRSRWLPHKLAKLTRYGGERSTPAPSARRERGTPSP